MYDAPKKAFDNNGKKTTIKVDKEYVKKMTSERFNQTAA